MSKLPLEITVKDLLDYMDDGVDPVILDVREISETKALPFDGATVMPMHTVPARQNELPDDKPIVVSCHMGGRSMQVVQFLRQAGFENVTNLQGGVMAWVNRE